MVRLSGYNGHMAYEPPVPELRASDADRERAVERLKRAGLDGRLDSEELEERIGAAYRARWTSELGRLTADVMPAPYMHPQPPAPPQPWPPPPVPYRWQPQAGTNGLAVASLVCALLWFVWVGSALAVAFGHAALSQLNQQDNRQEGRGLAIAGLVFGYLGLGWLALVIIRVAG